MHEAEAGEAQVAPPPLNRLPLTTPAAVSPHKRALEATWVAERIAAIVGHMVVEDTPPRPARYGDITLLYGKRADIDRNNFV